MPGTWTRLMIGAHPAEEFLPETADRPAFALIFLHPVGEETLMGNAVYPHVLDQLRLPCVCPYGGPSWWADRVCPPYHPTQSAEHYVLNDVLPYVQRRWDLGPGRVGLFGISMGGQGALRLGFKHPQTFPVVAGVASAIEYHQWLYSGLALDQMYDSKEQCRQDTVPMHVHPHHQPPHIYFCCDPADALWYRGNDRLHEKLAALGVAHTCDLATQAGGHSWAYFDAMAEPTVRFLHQGLQQQARRLL